MVEAITALVLDAAGICFMTSRGLTLLSGTFDAEAEAALAWCLREAVTNVVRHSGARNCWVTLRRVLASRLEVRDDGRGVAAAGGAVSPDWRRDATAQCGFAACPSGYRRSAAGWRSALAAAGFCLVATVPAGEGVRRRGRRYRSQ